jgi:hypothetical protein
MPDRSTFRIRIAIAKAALARLPIWVKIALFANSIVMQIALVTIGGIIVTQNEMLVVMANATASAEAAGAAGAANFRPTLYAVATISHDGRYWIYGMLVMMSISIGICTLIAALTPLRKSPSGNT